MIKIATLGTTVLLALTLAGCGNSDKKVSQKSSSTSTIKLIDKAKLDTDGLFVDNTRTKLLDGTTSDGINDVQKEVTSLKNSKTKTKLLRDVKKAKQLLPALKKSTDEAYSSESKKQESKLLEKEQSEDAESKAQEDSSRAKLESQKKKNAAKASSKKVLQSETKENSLYLVKEMHERMDGNEGISEKVTLLSKSPAKNMDDIKKEIKVLKNVIKECNDNYAEYEDYPSSDSIYVDELNEFWNLSAKILTGQKDYLRYLIDESSHEVNASDQNGSVDQWNDVYKKIINNN